MSQEFVHLHVHSHFSLLDGCASPKSLVREAKRQGMKALALTDHGALHGAVQFVRAAREEGIKPIIGCELYLAEGTLDAVGGRAKEATFHLTALAMDQTGYRNLSILSSLGFLEGFYYRPRVDRDLLARHSQGLIILSGCLAAEVPTLLAAGDYEAAKARAAWYLETFGRERYFLELMDHDLDEQKRVNDGLLRLHRELGLELVATNDVHYLTPEDAAVQDVLVCVQTGKRLDDPDRLRFETDQLYLRSAQDMARRFGHIDGALANTLKIAERCSADLLEPTVRLPRFGEGDADATLREQVFIGAVQRYGEPLPAAVVQRIEHELGVIRQMGFADYFLIVWDLVRFARSQGIAVGPGRGSSASSLVAYCLRITDVDPLEHGLLFERFLNPERVTMPDIDMDFCFVRRAEVLEYAINRYGKERVAQIGAFGTMAARAAVRDVGRAMGIPYGEVDKVAKLIPSGPGVHLREALESRAELREAAEADERTKVLLDTSLKVEGSPRHLTVHAAGIVISPEPLAWGAPLCTTSDGTVVTQFTGEDLESLGYLKMDLLGLRTLTVIDRALAMIQRREGRVINLDALPLDDPHVYAALSRGDAGGVFQLETGMFRSLLKEVQPRDFSDLVAILALGRPGPMIHLDEYLARRRGEKTVEFAHPALRPILSETYGIMLYQEQVMQAATALAGYSAGQADLLRRAMGKKKPEIMEAERERFLRSATARGVEEGLAARIFDDIAHFAEYGFAKSHSVAYALVAYRTAYLKVHFPVEFMAAQMSTVAAASERLGRYLQECRRTGIPVRGPDINASGVEFDVDRDGIRFGLSAIKHVGRALAQEIVAERVQRPFASFDDFCRRLAGHLSRQALESLVRAGAFDAMGTRSALLEKLDEALGKGQSFRRRQDEGQIALFAEETAETVAVVDEAREDEKLSLAERLADEIELLGAFVSTDPLKPHQEVARAYPIPGPEDEGAQKIACGVVVGMAATQTRRGDAMAFLDVEDADGRVAEIVLFPNLYQQLAAVQVGDVLLVYGKVEADEEAVKIVAQRARILSEQPWVVTVERESALSAVRKAFSTHPGDTPVILRLKGAVTTARLLISPRLWVDGSEGLRDELNRVEGVAVHGS